MPNVIMIILCKSCQYYYWKEKKSSVCNKNLNVIILTLVTTNAFFSFLHEMLRKKKLQCKKVKRNEKEEELKTKRE